MCGCVTFNLNMHWTTAADTKEQIYKWHSGCWEWDVKKADFISDMWHWIRTVQWCVLTCYCMTRHVLANSNAINTQAGRNISNQRYQKSIHHSDKLHKTRTQQQCILTLLYNSFHCISFGEFLTLKTLYEVTNGIKLLVTENVTIFSVTFHRNYHGNRICLENCYSRK
jgi:hypothetical protein